MSVRDTSTENWLLALPRNLLRGARRRPSSTLLALVAALGCAAFIVNRNIRYEWYSRQAEAALERGDRGQRRANLQQAREYLARCLAISDEDRLHFLAARAARRAGDSREAAKQLQLAEKQGWVAEAIELERALAQAQQGKLDKVEPALVSFVERGHPDKVLILEALAQGYLKSFQLPRALHCLDRWVQEQPDNPQALMWRGEARLRYGRTSEAIEDYRRAVELDPEEPESHEKLADLLLNSNIAAEALIHFEWLQLHRPDDREAALGVARCQASLGQTRAATDQLDRLIATEPRHAAALAERGKLAVDAGEAAAGEHWLRQSLAVAPFERETVYSLFRCLQFLNRPNEAKEMQDRIDRIDADRKRLDQLKSAVLASPHDPGPRSEMGRILLRNGQDKEGLRWLQSALAEDPRHGPSREALAEHGRKAPATHP